MPPDAVAAPAISVGTMSDDVYHRLRRGRLMPIPGDPGHGFKARYHGCMRNAGNHRMRIHDVDTAYQCAGLAAKNGERYFGVKNTVKGPRGRLECWVGMSAAGVLGQVPAVDACDAGRGASRSLRQCVCSGSALTGVRG